MAMEREKRASGRVGAYGQSRMACSVAEAETKLRTELEKRGIKVFALFDHAAEAAAVGLSLRPTRVLVFGSPSVGTNLMLADPRMAVELPLRVALWEDEQGDSWMLRPRMSVLAEAFGLDGHPVIPRLDALLDSLAELLSDGSGR